MSGKHALQRRCFLSRPRNICMYSKKIYTPFKTESSHPGATLGLCGRRPGAGKVTISSTVDGGLHLEVQALSEDGTLPPRGQPGQHFQAEAESGSETLHNLPGDFS